MDVSEQWVSVYTSTLLHNVELLRHLLQSHEVQAVVFNQKDSFYPVLGEIQLYVRRENVMKAKRIIEDSAL